MRPYLTLGFILLVGIVISCITVPAFAQVATGATASASDANEDVARSLFQAGKAAYESGNYSDALSFFEQAYARSKRAELLYNIGQAADRLRRDDTAIESFTKYLEQTPDAANRAEVEKRVKALQEARSARQQQPPQTEVVPTPEQTAQQSLTAPTLDSSDIAKTELTQGSADNTPVTEKWWFWTAVGAVVVGGTVTALVLALGGNATVERAPYQGNAGSVQAP